MSPNGRFYRTNRGYYTGTRVQTPYGPGYIRSILYHDDAYDRSKVLIRLETPEINEVEVWDADCR